MKFSLNQPSFLDMYVAAVNNERPWVTGQGQPDFWYLYKTIASLDFLASIMIFALTVTKK